MTREHVSLAIYNEGTSLVRERRSVTLQAGLNTLDITDVTAKIDATSVTFHAVESDIVVLEQNYLYDLVSRGALLRRYLEETIEITTDDGALFTGQLLSANSKDIILQQSDGQVIYASLDKIRDVRFPTLPDGLITRPTLRWLLQSAAEGTQSVELAYLTGGLNWTADYNLLLAADYQTFDINGWVTLDNTSGGTFEEAQVKLVAGDVKRIRPTVPIQDMVAGAAQTLYDDVQVDQREIFEYQLYEVKRPVRVATNETKQVEFVTGSKIPCRVDYILNVWTVTDFWTYASRPMKDSGLFEGTTNVKTWLEFSTGEGEGLGEDLPAGRMRVYQADVDGSAVLIGENRIDHTPQGETVRFELGTAFDLVGERTQTEFERRGNNMMRESYEIKLRNHKDSKTAEIRVQEILFRWRNWEILESSDPYTKLNAATIEFRVPVEAGAEKVITYTVRYSW